MRHLELSGHLTGNPNFTSPGQETQEKSQACKATAVLEFQAISGCSCLHSSAQMKFCSLASSLPPASLFRLFSWHLIVWHLKNGPLRENNNNNNKKSQTTVTLKRQPKFLFYYQIYFKISQSDTIPKFNLDSVPVLVHCYGWCTVLSLGSPSWGNFPVSHSLPSPPHPAQPPVCLPIPVLFVALQLGLRSPG